MSQKLSLVLVSSPQNPVFKDLLYALEGQGEHVLVHGLKVVRDLAVRGGGDSMRPRLRTILVRSSVDIEQVPPLKELLSIRFEQPVTRLRLDDTLFDQLDPFGVPDVIAAFERPALPTWSLETELNAKPNEKAPIKLLLATQNPSNLGACFRSASAFGVRDVVCLKEAASPFHPRAVRGSMGHVFDLKISRGPSIHDLCSDSRLPKTAVALDMNGQSIGGWSWPKGSLLLLGEEGQGVPKDWRGQKLSIDIASDVDSLNAAVSCGIALYEYSKKTGMS